MVRDLLRRIPGARRATRAARKLRRALHPRGVILVYHRIDDGRLDPFRLAVSPSDFDHQMKTLSRDACPLGLTEFAIALAERRLPRRAVAVTFDDGYADNLHVAQPTLRAYGIPATLFVTTDFLDRPSAMWWDEMAAILLETPSLPSRLELELPGGAYAAAVDDNEADALARCRSWTSYQTPRGARTRIFRDLSHRFRDLTAAEQEAAVRALRAWSGRGGDRGPRAMLTVAELRRIAADGVFDIGAHTRSHRRLGALSPEQQQAEIAGSKQVLEAMLGRSVTSFAYPYGGEDCYTALSMNIVAAAGFDRAVIVDDRSADPRSSPLRLSRRMVRGQWVDEGIGFRRWLMDAMG